MSAQAVGWVWKHSPFPASAGLIIHLAIADVVNDTYDNEFWMTREALAEKSRCSESSVKRTIRYLVDVGGLVVLERGGGRGNKTRFRFMMPEAGLPETGSDWPRFNDADELPTFPTGTPERGSGETGSRDAKGGQETRERGSGARAIVDNPTDTKYQAAQSAESVDNSRPPDPDCVSCQGSGSIYSATAGADVRCHCVRDPNYRPASSPTPMPSGLDAIERLRERRASSG